MKHESDDSGFIVYEIRDDYAVGTSPKSKKETDTTEKKGVSTSDQKQVDAESMAQLGGFSGRVYDKLTHRTIEGVLVTIAKDLSVRTDEKGMFSVAGIKPGKYRITAFEDGYVVHSCKGSAVAGETTILESFHLIPDCLATEYPEGTAQEEEETVEGEVVEFAMESPQATLSEEKVAVVEEPAITELPVSPVDTTIAETVQPEGVLEKIQEMAPEVAPQELTVEKTPIEAVVDERAQAENQEAVYQEQIFEPAIEEFSRQAVQLQEHQMQALEPEPFAEAVPEIIPQEKPPVEAYLEKMQTPVIDSDSTEAVISVPDKMLIEEEPSVEEIPPSYVEITNVEIVQSEEVPWEITVEEASIETAMEDAALEEIKEGAYQEQHLEPFAEESIEQAVLLPEYQTMPLEPFVDIAPEITLRRELSKGVYEEETPVEVSLEEIQAPAITEDLTEVILPVPEEIIIGEGPSVEELPFISVEPTYKEQSVEPSTEVIPQTVNENSVTSEEAPEDIADYDITSLSDEERAAMSSEDNTVKVAGFEGSVNAQPNPAFKGLLITIAYHLRNVACDDPNDLIIRITVANPDTGTIHETFEAPVTCTKDTFSIGGFTFSTAPYEAHVYTLNMQIISKKTKSIHLLAGTSLEIKNLF